MAVVKQETMHRGKRGADQGRDGGARENRRQIQEHCYSLHHCCSQGIPSKSPSIFVPGQLSRKKLASSHDVICEQ